MFTIQNYAGKTFGYFNCQEEAVNILKNKGYVQNVLNEWYPEYFFECEPYQLRIIRMPQPESIDKIPDFSRFNY